MARRVKKLTPFMCQVFMIITDTMIRMLEELPQDERYDTVQCIEQLILIVKELARVRDVPVELILWSQVLSKIEIID